MKIAIMQPYFLPYIGYFQLIYAVDKFVFYDDVNYIKSGWINRNRIIINNQPQYISLTLQKASSFKKINQITIDQQKSNKLLKTIELNYKKAPYFHMVFPMIEELFGFLIINNNLAQVAGESVQRVCNYLNWNKTFEYSSHSYADTQGQERAQRLISIAKKNKADTYINPIGGKTLYKKEDFTQHDINLWFINGQITPYVQFQHEFIPGLSIVDVLMFNSISEVHKMLTQFELV